MNSQPRLIAQALIRQEIGAPRWTDWYNEPNTKKGFTEIISLMQARKEMGCKDTWRLVRRIEDVIPTDQYHGN